MLKSLEMDSPIPRALRHSPRTVRRKPGTLGMLVLGRILTAPVLAIAATILAFVVLEPVVLILFPAEPARIVARWHDFKARHGIVYFVEYQFDRTGRTARDEVLPDEYQRFRVGQSVGAHLVQLRQLGYSALDRSLRAYVRFRMIAWFGALVAAVIGGALFYAIWIAPWRSRRLAKYGNATFGAVVDKGILRSGRRYLSYTLTYQFKARGALQARQIHISPQRYDSTAVKDLVIILFDPARPSRNIVYDYSDFIAS